MSAGDLPTTVRLGNLLFEWDGKTTIPGMAVSVMVGEDDGDHVGWAEPVRERDWQSFIDAQPKVTQIELERTHEFVPLDPGTAVIVDAVGSKAVVLNITGEEGVQTGLIFDVAGKLNKLDGRQEWRFILPVGIAAEIVASFVVAAQYADDIPGFQEEFSKALEREQGRIQREREGSPE